MWNDLQDGFPSFHCEAIPQLNRCHHWETLIDTEPTFSVIRFHYLTSKDGPQGGVINNPFPLWWCILNSWKFVGYPPTPLSEKFYMLRTSSTQLLRRWTIPSVFIILTHSHFLHSVSSLDSHKFVDIWKFWQNGDLSTDFLLGCKEQPWIPSLRCSAFVLWHLEIT